MVAVSAANPAGAAETIEVADGRPVAVHRPAEAPDTPMPLVLVLAGGGDTAEDVLKRQGWTGTADASGFVAAGLEAMPADPGAPAQPLRNPRVWTDGSAPPAAKPRPDDVAYVRAAIEAVSRRHPIDPGRIYAVGFADGGGMVQRLAVEMPGRLAAAASVAGHLHVPGNGERPPPLLLIFGGSDPLVPLNGGQVSAPGISDHRPPAVLATVGRWVAALGCPDAPAAAVDGPRVERRLWAPCAGGGELAVVLVRDLGHHWPGSGGGGPLPARLAGPTSDAVDGTAEIWAFLRRHARTRGAAAR
ncbi:polyhydroxybutyrate depolymerase [Constrictibacter sp. MBR-5]|jgi:polyhydroxybutyrate depolymerase|uniref:alpha/beta hydrolase family esterase n=1 Tax=Constrictibacter sp. MBR-5 TaxID=3156467 RepID=UPI0033963E69